eukprot:3224543-Pleurochrysis_carterae.AAC.1
MFKLADGQVVFTGGGNVARHATAEGTAGIIIDIMRAGDGAPEAVEATVPLAQSAAVLHNVLTIGPPRGGGRARDLRVEGVPATLVPLAGVPPHETIGLALAGHQPQR